MAYPPLPHTERNADKIEALIREHPFAHIFTTGTNGHNVTRLPFMMDSEDGKIVSLRAHMNAQNPQVTNLDGCDALVAFSGPHSYVSPNWRVDKYRGGTWDYTSVHVWGTVSVRTDQAFFEKLINDLSSAVEPKFETVLDAPVWSTKDAAEGYIERLFPLLTAFEIQVTRVQGISKLHQDFASEDALSAADYLARSEHPDSRRVAAQIRANRSDGSEA